VFWKLANGEVFEQPFTVREGETMFDIARDLEAGNFMPASDFCEPRRCALIQIFRRTPRPWKDSCSLPRITCRGILLQQGLQRRW